MELTRANFPEGFAFGAATPGNVRGTEDGAKVQSCLHWSLLDNYNWAEGYDDRFGMVHVDFETRKRTPKATCHMLKKAISEG